MGVGALLDRIDERVALDKEEGDIAYFHALTLQLEYLTKLVTAGVVACLGEDADRHKYSLEHKLVRADSIGDWVETLNTALIGPSAQFFRSEASGATRQLTERVEHEDWRHKAVHTLNQVAAQFGIEAPLGAKVALRQFFQIGASIRNRSRGHGATTSGQCGEVCPLLADAIAQLMNGIALFKLPWAYLHRNLSGKYRVSPLLGECAEFGYLKRARDIGVTDGVYTFLGQPLPVRLVFSDADLRDIYVANGSFKSTTFEVLSYVTNETKRFDGSDWLGPPGRLPPSETEGPALRANIG